MAPLLLGINGFGPVGRALFFASLSDPTLAVVALNDPSCCTEYVAYLIENELPSHRRDAITVEVLSDDYIVVNGTQRVRVTHAHDACSVGWGDLQVKVVFECTGTCTTRERSWSHVSAGAAAVIISAQSADAATVVPCVNGKNLGKGLPVLCAGVSVGAALAPLVDILTKTVGVEELSYTAVLPMQPADPAAGRCAEKREWRQARMVSSGSDAIAPHQNNGSGTLTKLFPQLIGRLSATALQVPVREGCAIDVVLRSTSAVTKEQLDSLIAEQAAQDGYKAIMQVASNSFCVSSDCVGSPKLHYDAQSSQTTPSGTSHKLLLWVDLKASYASHLLSLAKEAGVAIAAKS